MEPRTDEARSLLFNAPDLDGDPELLHGLGARGEDEHANGAREPLSAIGLKGSGGHCNSSAEAFEAEEMDAASRVARQDCRPVRGDGEREERVIAVERRRRRAGREIPDAQRPIFRG